MSALFGSERALKRRLVVFALVSATMLWLDYRGQQLERVRAVLMAMTYPVQRLVEMPTDALGFVANTFTTHRALRKENARLSSEVRDLKLGMQRFEAMQRENQRLRRLLGSATEVTERVRGAELIAVETTESRRFVVIDKGARHGVFVGQPVLDADGVLGQVVHVGPFSATTMLITDAGHAVPVRIDRTGLRAVARGQHEGDMLALSFVPNTADVEVGDVVVTSGLGGRFPEGYIVGRVAQIDADPGNPFARIDIQPGARLGNAREVLLVWPREATLPGTGGTETVLGEADER